MAFTIPDVAVALNAIQTRVQTGDLQILVDGTAGVGVVSGCAVTAQASPNMTVAVAAGTVRIGGADVAVSSGNVTVTANATGNPRLDLICVNGSGTKSAQAGTAAATPKYPTIPASSVVLYAVYVPASLSAVTSSHITDKRVFVVRPPVQIVTALSDETTTITTGAAKVTMRMPFAMTVTAVRSSVNTVSSSGLVTVDINEGAGAGTSILSTKLSIDATEFTSTTAATPAVISDTALADDAQITFDIDAAGTGAKGLKVTLIGYQS